jgi:exodeoxyribonuclease VII small subunit
VRVVSKAKNADAVSADLQNLPFEEAIKRLESIVESMESQDLPLETLLARYEEGSKLSQICQSKLAGAELKIQQLDKNSKGELSLKPVNVPEQSQ